MKHLLAILLLACALPAFAADAQHTIYALDEDAAKAIARQVMEQAHGAGKANEWIERTRTTFSISGGGVVRGGWSWGISLRQVAGLTADGRRVSGVLFEPHASHGPGTGKGQFTEEQADKLLRAALAAADKTGKGIAVAKLLGDEAALPASAPVALSEDAEQIAAKLRALKSLADSGAITQAEYEAKKKELLARF